VEPDEDSLGGVHVLIRNEGGFTTDWGVAELKRYVQGLQRALALAEGLTRNIAAEADEDD
jgi:hypothetical protein